MSRGPRGLVPGLALAVLLAMTVPASATLVAPIGFDALAEDASAVIIGRVEAIESYWDAPRAQIFTNVTLSVDEVLKGDLTVGALTIQQVGGTVGDLHSWVFGSPEFKKREKVLLFLRLTPDGALRVAHLYQGKFSILTDAATGEELAYREAHADGVSVMAPPGSPLAPEIYRVKEAKDRVRAASRHNAVTKSSVAAPATTGVSQTQEQFTLLGSARWFQPDLGLPVLMLMNATGEPAAPTLGFDQIRAAYQAWSAVPGASFRYADGGFTTAGGFQGDGVNAISFRDPLNQMDAPSGCGGTLAIGGFFSGGQTTVVNGQTFAQILEGDVVINDGWQGCGFYESPSNFEEVVTHELGHVLGLGHSSDPNATMAAFAHFDGRGASLTPDDAAGLVFIYPGTPPPLPSFTLGVTKLGSGTGTVTTTPAGIACGNTCSASYDGGTMVALTAVPDPGYVFTGWSGSADCADGQVRMVAPVSCVASFAQGPDLVGQFPLVTVTATSRGSRIDFTLVVQNAGDLLATGSVLVRFYLSNDAVLDAGDTLLTSRTVRLRKLAPGAAVSLRRRVSVTGPVQGKYLIAEIDGTNGVLEGNEGNNVVLQLIP